MTVAIAPEDTSAVTVSPTSLTFTASNWQTWQSVTVTGVADTVDNATAIRTVCVNHTASSTDADYDGVTARNQAVVLDDEVASQAGAAWSEALFPGRWVPSGSSETFYGYDASGTSSRGYLSGTTIRSRDQDRATVESLYQSGGTLTLAFEDDAQLPSWMSPAQLVVDGTRYTLEWDSVASVYARTNVGALFSTYVLIEVHLLDPSPKDLAVAPGAGGGGQLDVSWTATAGATSHSVRYRARGTPAWTTAVAANDSSHTITGLINGTRYIVQAGATLDGHTYWTQSKGGTPVVPPLLNATMTVACKNSGVWQECGYFGSENPDDATGALDPDGFSYGGTAYQVRSLFYHPHASNTVGMCVDVRDGVGNRMADDTINALRFEWDDQTIQGGWSVSQQGSHCQANVMSLTAGTQVPVKIYDEDLPRPAQPTALAATPGNGQVTLAWTADSNTSIYRWETCHAKDATECPSDATWTEVSGSGHSTRSATVTDLTNGDTYAFQVRAVNASGEGPASDAVTATPNDKAMHLSATTFDVFEHIGVREYTLSLLSAPSADVTVSITADVAGSLVLCEGAGCTPYDSTSLSLTFTSTDFAAKTIRFIAVNDTVDNAGNRRDVTLAHEATSSDSGYNGLTASASVRVIDDEIVPVDGAFYSGVLLAGSYTYAGHTYEGYDSRPTFAFYGNASRTALSGALLSGYFLDSLFEVSYRAGRPYLYFEDRAGARTLLPEPFDQHFILQVGDDQNCVLRDGTNNHYLTASGATFDFVPGTLYDVHLVNPSPKDVKLTGHASAFEIEWSAAPNADSYTVAYRRTTAGSTTTTLASQTSPALVTGLENGASYYVRVGAVDGTRTFWSFWYAVAVGGASYGETLLDTTLTVGNRPGNGGVGYSRYSDESFGDLEDATFTYEGTTRTITKLAYDVDGTDDDRLCLNLDPGYSRHEFLGRFVFRLKGIEFLGREAPYTNGADQNQWGYYGYDGKASNCIATNGLSLTPGEQVSLIVALPTAPAAPTNLFAAADDGAVNLYWDGPTDHDITAWEYRYKGPDGGYNAWTEIPWSHHATRSYQVTGLTNGDTYALQLRAKRGRASSPGTTATATPQQRALEMLIDTTMTVGQRSTAPAYLGYSDHDWTGEDFGGLAYKTFEWDGTTYTIKGLFYGIQPFTSGKRIFLMTEPDMDASVWNLMELRVSNVAHPGSSFTAWTPTRRWVVRDDHIELVKDATVRVRIGRLRGPSGPAVLTAAATGNDGQVKLSWHVPTQSSITRWEYRYKTTAHYGAWTRMEVSSASTRSHVVHDLIDGVPHTFQVRPVSNRPGSESPPATATPLATHRALLDTTMVVGTKTVDGHLSSGFSRVSSIGTFGSMAERSFDHQGTTWRVDQLTHWNGDVWVRLDSDVSASRLNALTVHVKYKTYSGGWSAGPGGAGAYKQDASGLSLTKGETVRVSFSSNASGRPAAPYDFKVVPLSDSRVKLTWNAVDDSSVTRWEYRFRSDGAWSAWRRAGPAAQRELAGNLGASPPAPPGRGRSAPSRPSPALRRWCAPFASRAINSCSTR